MQKRVALPAAFVATLLSLLLFALPGFASAAPASWLGMYVPGAPGSMAPVAAVESQLSTKAAVVNFFITDTDGFPTSQCANVSAAGSTPLITLEFFSTQNGGLDSITDGSRDAYLAEFASDAKAYGKTVWLRPFHEMNGDWYPWGTVAGNSPAKLIAAYRHVHDVFAGAGATNVKFVWCPNVDFNVTSFYPGDAYVDYAAMDGYNNGKPWRSFSSIFGPTYNSVAAVSSKPIFIAETSSVEGGTGKAAWITDMFSQIATNYPRIVGVCWFEAKLMYDWRVGTSASSVAAMSAAANGDYRAIDDGRARTTLSIKTNVKRIKRKHAVRISGVLKPGRSGTQVRVVLSVPKHKGSSKLVRTSASGAWSFRYTPKVRGTYYLRVTYAGDSTRTPGSSKTIRLVVK